MAQQNQLEVVRGWSAVAISRFRKNIRKEKIGFKNKLISSFKVATDGTDTVSRVRLSYLDYGKYVDMGVGRGMPIGGKKVNPNYSKKRNAMGQFLKSKKRVPKKWYSKTMYSETIALGILMKDHFGNRGMSRIISEIKGSVTVNL